MRQFRRFVPTFFRALSAVFIWVVTALVMSVSSAQAQDIVTYTDRTIFNNELPAINSIQTLETFSGLSNANMSDAVPGNAFNGFTGAIAENG